MPGYPKGFRTLYGQLSSIRRIALTLGLPLEHDRKVDIVQRYHERMQELKPLPPRFVKDGPILENVIEGDAIDVLKFPVPRHHELDTARFIGTADCVMTKDPDDGWFNLGAYRSQVYDGKTVGCQITEGKHGRIHRDKYFERGEPMKVVILCGQDPLLFMLSSSPLPEVSEMDIAGGLARRADRRGARALYRLSDPGRLRDRASKARPCPARCRPEGPFGEWMGYYSDDTRAAALRQRQDHPPPQRSDPHLRAAAQAGRRDRAAQGHRRRGADLARARRLRRARRARRVEPRGRTGDALHRDPDPPALSGPRPQRAARRVRTARAAPMPANGPWWSTRTSTPAISTRCCGRCARGSIPRPTSTSSRRPGRRSAIRCILPGNFNNRILIDACIPYDKKLNGTFPPVVDVSADLRAKLRAKFPKLFH